MGICEKCRRCTPEVTLRQSDDMLCNSCEAERVEGLKREVLQRQSSSSSAAATSTPQDNAGSPANTTAVETTEPPGGQHETLSTAQTQDNCISGPGSRADSLGICVAECQFRTSGGGKRLRCCVCARHYHIKCLNLPSDEIKGNAWPCPECRVLPHDVKHIRSAVDSLTNLMNNVLDNKFSEFSQIQLKCQKLQIENEKLREQNMKIEHEMQCLKSHLNDIMSKSSSPKGSLVLGSSLIRNFDPEKLSNTKVCCMPGARVPDIRDKLSSIAAAGDRYHHIYLVVGGNDCSGPEDTTDLEARMVAYKTAVTIAKRIADNVTISAIPPRLTPAHALQNITTLNEHLATMSAQLNVTLVSANEHFYIQNGQVNDGYFVDQVHLTVKGSNKLAEALCLPRKVTDGPIDICSRFPKSQGFENASTKNPAAQSTNRMIPCLVIHFGRRSIKRSGGQAHHTGHTVLLPNSPHRQEAMARAESSIFVTFPCQG